MLSFITKSDVFAWVDEGVPLPKRGNLKDFQDCFILSLLHRERGRTILEMGGGDSRVLRHLAPNNECWNVETFEGRDGGPSHKVAIPGVRNIYAAMGSFSTDVPTSYFDYVISISVIEHIKANDLPNVMEDCARVLKPGGLSAHAIDIYLFDRDQHNQPRNRDIRHRMGVYRSLTNGKMRLLEPDMIPDDPFFSTKLVSNPDHAMLEWNKVAPTMRNLRETASAASIKAIWQKSNF